VQIADGSEYAVNEQLALRIMEKARSLGYEQAGIIPLADMIGYDERFEERLRKVPESAEFYERLRRLTRLGERYPWARSVIVAVQNKGKFKIPDALRGQIALDYLFDTRIDENSPEYHNIGELTRFFGELGIKTEYERKSGVVGARWAAMMAGLGTIRRNNFFYSDIYGSFASVVSWLADKEMSWKRESAARPCPDGCDKCIKHCPTNSLSAPYTMSPTVCVSYLTTRGIELTGNPLRKRFGSCVYGCAVCQQVCPQNKGKWKEEIDFPGVAELASCLVPQAVLAMSESFYKEKVQPKFFYLAPDQLWKWQVNALNYMSNNNHEKYRDDIIAACEHHHEKVSAFAQTLCRELRIGRDN
jgi:epoxyqueuosine reductase